MSGFQKYCYGANNYALHTFVDAFQGHYKDSTESGTCDCQWFAGIYFLSQILLLYIIYGATVKKYCQLYPCWIQLYGHWYADHTFAAVQVFQCQ